MANKNLQAAKAAKKDEFYTQLSDIEKELCHYREHFKGKTVMCNCDDPRVSNFYKYFMMGFKALGLKRLICTCYKSQDVDLFSTHDAEEAVYIDYYGEEEKILPLKGDGDFRSKECIELLKQADIICTNPPFSLFREYVAQLMKYEKKFLIIGTQTASCNKEIFPYILEGKVWYGFHHGHTLFAVPDDYDVPEFYDKDDRSRLNSNGYKYDETGKLWRNLGNICWYTNLDHSKRHEPIIMIRKYNPSIYPKYYNYDAIDVSKVEDIPEDYFGEMGVPISFLEKYCPEQFEIIGNGTDVIKTKNHVAYKEKGIITYEQNGIILWQTPYTVSERKLGNSLRIEKNGEPANAPFSRIIIRRKDQPKP